IGALLMEMDEKWSSGKRYLDMTEYHEWKKQQQQAKKVSKVTPIR
nr:IS256 family transposase [Bacillota bacterium]